ncbi:unnamed protein product [Rhizoctonia solani]|uniref:L-tryptophan decarboxylase PsiD-like domain-containing protein n=1 Tax=Rhizoctonia solani TaxID=456999 RepID=A0A8H2XJM2_9AGAM|nr:unnamed protein product [Rhizoctonia solani]CAE6428658.1 unnamed protein product [Rhizoctonia solani]
MPLNIARYNGWIPSPVVYDAFIKDAVQIATRRNAASAEHVASVKKFQEAIEADDTMVELFKSVFRQTPDTPNKIRNFEHMLHLFDSIVTVPPQFKVVQEHGVSEPIGVPMYLVFDLLSNTSAAYDLFRMEAFNKALKDLLCDWGAYLKTDDSNKTLHDQPGGWFSQAALNSLEAGRGVFNETYILPNPDAVNRGYQSWDDFFTRRIRVDKRPILLFEGKSVIYNACESTVERISRNVQAHDLFWLKGTMAYSLYDMFAGDRETADQFVGGTVYQAFLSPQDYHRWHSPIAGKVVNPRVIPGTYYAVVPDEGDDGDMRGALIRCQPWLTVAATRAVMTIVADDPKIGTVGFIGVGMAEVSTCHLSVRDGDTVKPGDELGMFHFGGSSHTIIYGPQASPTFTDEVQVGQHLHVNRIIAAIE